MWYSSKWAHYIKILALHLDWWNVIICGCSLYWNWKVFFSKNLEVLRILRHHSFTASAPSGGTDIIRCNLYIFSDVHVFTTFVSFSVTMSMFVCEYLWWNDMILLSWMLNTCQHLTQKNKVCTCIMAYCWTVMSKRNPKDTWTDTTKCIISIIRGL